MLKKLILAAASCLLSFGALAQSNNPSCVLSPTDPTCACLSGENDGDCTFGVHRGLIVGTAIHDSAAAALTQDRAAAALHLSR